MTEPARRPDRLAALCLGALGVVYGDMGTSPLYALRECFHGPNAIAPEPANVLGVLSLVFWSLVLVISVKYLAFVMRADNEGEIPGRPGVRSGRPGRTVTGPLLPGIRRTFQSEMSRFRV